MNPEELLAKYFEPGALPLMLTHSRLVARKALWAASNYRESSGLDLEFINEAAQLHDIGVAMTNAPSLGCHGRAPYILHGILGREILEKEGLPRHALVCERHIGVGLTVEDIIGQNLPLPHRDMVPLTIEEKIVAFADLFYSKNPSTLGVEKGLTRIREDLARFGAQKVVVFNEWLKEFAAEKAGLT